MGISELHLRLATYADLTPLRALMDNSIRALLKPYLDDACVGASFEIMGLDTQLIDDGTYFIAEIAGQIVGSGGWSKRATLFGGDHTSGRDAALLNPATDAARVRAMYTEPAFTRRDIGRMRNSRAGGGLYACGVGRNISWATPLCSMWLCAAGANDVGYVDGCCDTTRADGESGFTEQLAALMARHNVGARIDEILFIKKVDEDFFVDE
jgi:hypothetical protein